MVVDYTNAIKPVKVSSTPRKRMRAFDRLPSDLRAVLRESRCEYSAERTLSDWRKYEARGMSVDEVARRGRKADQRMAEQRQRQVWEEIGE